jgi:hypothetical protein
MTLKNIKGHVHIFVLIFVVILVLLFAPPLFRLLTSHQPQEPSSEYITGFEPDLTNYNNEYHGDPVRESAKKMINTAIDQQARLMRLKAEAFFIAWDSLDNNSRKKLLSGITGDVNKQYDAVSKFLGEFNNAGWSDLSSSDQQHRIDELVKSISIQQDTLSKFVKMMNKQKVKGR